MKDCFERTNGGPLLLHEITEAHPEVEGKLLRTPQEQRVLGVDRTRAIRLDVRVRAGCSRPRPMKRKLNTLRLAT